MTCEAINETRVLYHHINLNLKTVCYASILRIGLNNFLLLVVTT